MLASLWKLTREIFHAGSEVGINLLLWNTIILFWYAVVQGKDLPSGVVTVILGIFTGKTVHSVSKTFHKPTEAGE